MVIGDLADVSVSTTNNGETLVWQNGVLVSSAACCTGLKNVTTIGTSGLSWLAEPVGLDGVARLNSVSGSPDCVIEAVLDVAHHNIEINLNPHTVGERHIAFNNISIDILSDVAYQASQTNVGDCLQWNGTQWVAVPPVGPEVSETADWPVAPVGPWTLIPGLSIGPVGGAGQRALASFSAQGSGTEGSVALFVNGVMIAHSLRTVTHGAAGSVNTQAIVTLGPADVLEARASTPSDFTVGARSLVMVA